MHLCVSFCVYMTRLNTRKFAVFLLLFFMCDDVLFYVQHENMSGASKKGIQDGPLHWILLMAHLMQLKPVGWRCAEFIKSFSKHSTFFLIFILGLFFHNFMLWIVIYVFIFISQAQSSEPLVGYKRQRSKAIICRGKRPDDIVSNESLPGDAENVSDKSGGVDKPPNPKRQKTGGNEVFSASPY